MTASATSIILQSFATPDGTAITIADFGTTGYGTLEPGTSNEEQITFTGVTQNGDGTATLTSVTRGIAFTAPYAETAGLKKTHSGGSIFVLANTAKMYDQFFKLDDNGVATQVITFTSPNFPKMNSATASPVDDEQLATKYYVDTVGAGSAVNINKLVVMGNAGETVSAGNFVYFDETDKEWKKTDADSATTSENVLLGIAQGSGVNGGAIANGVLLQGRDSNQSGLTSGDLYYLSGTAGVITSSAGTKEVEVGYAVSATEIIFTPKFKHFITEDQKDALGGTSGTPSNTNKYVTADDVSATAAASKIVRSGAGSKIVEGYLQMTDAQATLLTGGNNANTLHRHREFSTASVFSGTAPTSYTDLDLSGTIGANQRVVMLAVTITGSPAYIAFRRNGDTGAAGDAGSCNVIASDAALSSNAHYVVVTTDTSGIIEWIASAGSISVSITVEAYW